MEQILTYLIRMVPAALVGLLAYLILRPFRLKRMRWRAQTTTAGHEVALALLFLFTAGLLWLTVLPEIRWEGGRLLLRHTGLNGVNLRPFMIFRQSRILAQQGNGTYFLINFWGNIAIFLPLGFLPALLWRRCRWWQVLPAGIALSAAIELCQLPTARGTDIDDLWLNALGVLLGYILARVVGKLWPALDRGCKVQEVSPWT